jgi:hypothetical protein
VAANVPEPSAAHRTTNSALQSDFFVSLRFRGIRLKQKKRKFKFRPKIVFRLQQSKLAKMISFLSKAFALPLNEDSKLLLVFGNGNCHNCSQLDTIVCCTTHKR